MTVEGSQQHDGALEPDETQRVSPADDRLSWAGAVSVERTSDWVRPWQLPHDMWLALTDPSLALTGRQLLAAFDPYRPDGLTAKAAINTLHDHLRHDDFRTDTNNLIVGGPTGYDIDVAALRIIDDVLSHL